MTLFSVLNTYEANYLKFQAAIFLAHCFCS